MEGGHHQRQWERGGHQLGKIYKGKTVVKSYGQRVNDQSPTGKSYVVGTKENANRGEGDTRLRTIS